MSTERPDDEARLLDELYAGVDWQRMRLRNDQRLEDWLGVAAAGQRPTPLSGAAVAG